jgi:RNA polymerase nonessential primary-like sigma factor
MHRPQPQVIRESQPDSVRAYLNEIGRYPLLTPEQEVELGQRVQAMMNLLEKKAELEHQLGREVSAAELAADLMIPQVELQRILQQGHRAKQKMVEANLRLVVNVAKNYRYRGVEFMDLVQEGSFGLQRGIEKFEPTRGHRLSTYIFWWITQSITRAIAEKSRPIRLPVHIHEKLNKIKKVRQQLSQKLGRNPTCDEIGAVINLPSAKIRETLEYGRPTRSLDEYVGDAEEVTLLELLEADGITPEDYVEQLLMRGQLVDLLSQLSDRQQEVLCLRYGLVDGISRTLAAVGDEMGVTRERVRQVETKALQRLLKRRGRRVAGYQ